MKTPIPAFCLSVSPPSPLSRWPRPRSRSHPRDSAAPLPACRPARQRRRPARQLRRPARQLRRPSRYRSCRERSSGPAGRSTRRRRKHRASVSTTSNIRRRNTSSRAPRTASRNNPAHGGAQAGRQQEVQRPRARRGDAQQRRRACVRVHGRVCHSELGPRGRRDPDDFAEFLRAHRFQLRSAMRISGSSPRPSKRHPRPSRPRS